MKMIALMITILGFSTLVFGETRSVRKEIRSPSGKLQYTTTKRGDRTEVRDHSGKLVETFRRIGNRIEVRSPSGKLIQTIKITE